MSNSGKSPYSVLHPEIRTYRTEGEPFVVIRIFTARVDALRRWNSRLSQEQNSVR